MKKRIITLILTVLTVVTVIGIIMGCGNKSFIDTTYTFDNAIIRLQDGEIVKGKVEKWTDFEDGDQIQVTVDGKTYLVHSSNVDLIAE